MNEWLGADSSYTVWRCNSLLQSSECVPALTPSLITSTLTVSSRPSNPLSASDSASADHCACLQIIFTYLLITSGSLPIEGLSVKFGVDSSWRISFRARTHKQTHTKLQTQLIILLMDYRISYSTIGQLSTAYHLRTLAKSCTRANSAFYPRRDGNCVPAKRRRCSVAGQ